jgi:sarcosine oxidase
MGCAAAWQLARRGVAVTVLERFGLGHARGSSHGDSRIFRLGYPQPAYVAMAVQAAGQWRALEAASGQALLSQVGALDHGAASELGALEAAYAQAGVGWAWLTAAEAADRWPGMRFASRVLLQPDGGRLHAARALAALRACAVASGAVFHDDLGPVRVTAGTGAVTAWAASGSWSAGTAVVTVGAWAADVLREVVTLPPLRVTQEQVAFFAPVPGVEPASWPAFIHRLPAPGYGLWTPGQGVKVGEHHTGAVTTGDDRDFVVDPVRLARVEAYVAHWLPGLLPRATSAETCLYTTTPTEDFVIDRVGEVVFAAGFSGHGFKFTPLVGSYLADLVQGTGTPPAHLRLP